MDNILFSKPLPVSRTGIKRNLMVLLYPDHASIQTLDNAGQFLSRRISLYKAAKIIYNAALMRYFKGRGVVPIKRPISTHHHYVTSKGETVDSWTEIVHDTKEQGE